MENPFDQFDAAPAAATSPNPFDRFDSAQTSVATNPFDRFDDDAPDFSNVEHGGDTTAPRPFTALLERGLRSAASGTINLATTLYEATPSGMAERTAAALSGVEPPTSSEARAVSKDMLPPQAARDDYAGRAADFIGGAIPIIGSAVLTGGSAAPGVFGRMVAGARGMALPAAEAARATYEQGRDAGLGRVDALERAGVAGAGALAMGALPASAGGGVLSRMVTGGALGTAAGELQADALNAVSPDDMQHDRDTFDRAADFGFGAAIGAIHRPAAVRADGHVDALAGEPSRPDFSVEAVRQDPTVLHPEGDVPLRGWDAPADPGEVPQAHVPGSEARARAPHAAELDVARAALDRALTGVDDFDSARPIAERIAAEHGVGADELLPVPDWLSEPTSEAAQAGAQREPAPSAADPAASGAEAGSAALTKPEAPHDTNTAPRADEVRAAISNLERLGLDADAIAMVRSRLTDEPIAQDARAAEDPADANTGSRPAGEGTTAALADSHAQRTPAAPAVVDGPMDPARLGDAEPAPQVDADSFDALVDRAQAAGASLGEITAATRSTDEAVALQALRELIVRKDGTNGRAEELRPKAARRLPESEARAAAEATARGRAQQERVGPSDEEQAALSTRGTAPPPAEFGAAEHAGLAPAEAKLPARVDAAARAWREKGTNSPFFRRFFDGSKVTDDTGAPRVVHHGTGDEFSVFEDRTLGRNTGHMTAPLGHFFTESRAEAQRYATKAADGVPADERVVSAYLAIKHPARMTLDEFLSIDSYDGARAVKAKLRSHGHDGIRLEANGKVQWIAFKPEQIKSTENRGTFAAEDPDIRFARRGAHDSAPAREVDLDAVVERTTAGWKNAPGVESVESFGELPTALREHARKQGSDGSDVVAAWHDGTLWLVKDHPDLGTATGIERAIFHEAWGHHGVRLVFGKNTPAALERFAAGMGGLDGIRRYAGKYGIDLSAYEDGILADTKLGDAQKQAILLDELAAHIAQNGPPRLRQRMREYLGAIKAWLREHGFPGLARLSDLDLAHLLKQARHAVIDGVARAPGSGGMYFQRSAPEAPAPHLTDAQRAALDKIGTKPEPLTRKLDRLLSRWQDKATQGLVDQFAPFKDLDETAYMQARLSRGVDGAVEAAFLHGPVKLTDGALDVDTDGKGLRGVLANLKGEHDLFLAWIAGNRAERLAKEGRERLFSEADIGALKALNRGTMPDGRSRIGVYAHALREFNKHQAAVLDVAQEAGLISATSRASWEQGFYVPFRRVDLAEHESIDPADLVPKRREPGTPEPIERLKGGTSVLGDLLGNTLENWSRLLTSSMRNMAGTRALTAAEKIGAAQRIKEPTKTSVRVRIDGEAAHYEVADPLLLDAMTMLHFNGWQSRSMRVLSTFKRALTFGVTISPTFRVRNLLRDTVSALAVSDHTGANPLRNMLDGWEATRDGSETNTKLLAGGGKVRFGSLTDGDHAAAAKRLIRAGIDEGQILDTPAKAKKALHEAWRWYQETGDRGESVNRAVIYDRARAAGKSHLEASYEARDLLDFTMGGKWAATRFLVQTVPFLNARMQGLYKLGRGAKANPRRFAATAGAVAMASVALYLAQRDDKDYRALPDWARDSYWCVKLGDKMLYLPKPFEVGALGSVAERSAEFAIAGTDYRASDFANSLLSIAVDQLAMNPIPQAIRPALEAGFNYDTWRGRPIDTAGQERLPASQRYTARTSAAAVQLGGVTGVSPNRIEHMVKGYFGWLGAQALSVADAMVRPFTDMPANPRRDFAKVDNLAILGDFVKDAEGASSKYVERLYAEQQRLEQLYAQMREAARSGDHASIDTIKPKLTNLGTYRGGAKALAAIRAEIRRVEADRTLSADAMRQRLDELNAERNRIAAEVDAKARAASP